MKHYFLAFFLFVFVTPLHAKVVERYLLNDGDRISIYVYGEPDLSLDILLSTGGTFDYPYLGQINAAGKTVQALQYKIEQGLRGDYLIEPKVTISVIQFRKFYVNGEVKNPGSFDYQPGLTIDKAIAIAGGFTDRASRKKIQKTDGKTNSTHEVRTLSQHVNPGDIILVKQSFF